MSEGSAPGPSVLLGVPCIVDELKTVDVEVGDVGGIVPGGEVAAICWFTFVRAAGFDCRCVYFIGATRGRPGRLGATADFAKARAIYGFVMTVMSALKP